MVDFASLQKASYYGATLSYHISEKAPATPVTETLGPQVDQALAVSNFDPQKKRKKKMYFFFLLFVGPLPSKKILKPEKKKKKMQ